MSPVPRRQFSSVNSSFAEDFVELWINYKKKTEADPVRMRPHPYEFHLYYDI